MTVPILILPCWRYHATQGGKIFRTQAEIDAAHASGWRDSPGAAAAVGAPLVGALVSDPDGGTPGEAMPDDGVAEALEAAEDAIEQAQKVIRKRRKK